MKKVIIGVIIGLVLYSAFTTFGVYMSVQEYNEIVDEYNNYVEGNGKVSTEAYNQIKERCEELYYENQRLKEKRYNDAGIINSAISLISQDAIGAIAGEAYIAVIPDEAMNKVDAKQIAAALSMTDVEYCVLTFIGDGVASYSIRIDK